MTGVELRVGQARNGYAEHREDVLGVSRAVETRRRRAAENVRRADKPHGTPGETHRNPPNAPIGYIPVALDSADLDREIRQGFLATAGITELEAALWDGSGLSRLNLVSPNAVVKLLRYAATQPWATDYAATLPIAGVDGSLAHRFAGTPAQPSPAKERIQAKTGSLTHVNALSGYATTLAGERLAFSIFSNNQSAHGKQVIATIDRIAEAIVTLTRPPLPPTRHQKKSKAK